MAAPASLDLRRRVVEAYLAGEGTYAVLAERFAVGEASVDRWLRLYRETQGVVPRPHGGGKRPRLDDEGLQTLRALVEAQPDATLEELAGAYRAAKGVELALSVVHRALARLGLTRKKRHSMRRNASGTTLRHPPIQRPTRRLARNGQ